MHTCLEGGEEEGGRERDEWCRRAMHTRVYMHTLSLNYDSDRDSDGDSPGME